MGRKKDNALNRKVHNRDIDVIDKFVFIYLNGNEKERYEAQARILEYFDGYLEKYTSILQGIHVDLQNYDTRLFLALFLSGKDKNQTTFRHQCRQINKTLSNFSREDLKNEVTIVFLKVLSKYRIYEGVNALNPLTKIFRWRLKDWYNRTVRDALYHTREVPVPRGEGSLTVEQWIDLIQADTVDYDKGLEAMDLSWVNAPQKAIYQTLSKYERYLLYLLYGESISVSQVAKQLGRDKDTVKRHIKIILSKLEQAHLNGNGE